MVSHTHLFYSDWRFQVSGLHMVWFHIVRCAVAHALNQKSLTCAEEINMSCIHLPQRLPRLLHVSDQLPNMDIYVSIDLYLCYFVRFIPRVCIKKNKIKTVLQMPSSASMLQCFWKNQTHNCPHTLTSSKVEQCECKERNQAELFIQCNFLLKV